MKGTNGKGCLVNIVIVLLILVLIVGLLILGFRLFYLLKDKGSIDDTKDLRKEIESDTNDEDEVESDENSSPLSEKEEGSNNKPSDEVAERLSDLTDKGIELSNKLLKELREKYQNDDVIGYLILDGFDVEYPIMQGETNDSYLKTSPYKGYDYNGSIFLDCENNYDFTDSRSVIYGHNMINNSMFGCLNDFYQGNVNDKYFTIYSEKGILKYKVLCCGTINAFGENYFLYPGKTMMKEYLEKGLTEVEIDSAKELEKADMPEFFNKVKSGCISWCDDTFYDSNSKVVTLMTCYADGGTYRFGVTGILQLSDEDVEKMK